MSPLASDRALRWLVAILSLATILDQAWMVHTTIGYASDDLTVVWLATTDYARGVFHEPFFYGQDYGVMLEALLAAPFVRLGADPVRTVSMLLGIFNIVPFLAFALHHRLRHEYWAALVFAAMPLLLPVQHGLQITALNGIAVLALVPLAWRSNDPTRQSFALMLILGAAIFVNPNAGLVATTLASHHLYIHRKNGRTWLAMAIGGLLVLGSWYAVRSFFIPHPDAVVNTIFDWRMHFKPHLLSEAVQRLDLHFAWTAPLVGAHGALALLMLVVATVLLFRNGEATAAWALTTTLLLMVLAFCFPKVHDGAASIFFPLARVFLGIPLVLAWAFARLAPQSPSLLKFAGALVAVALLHGAARIATARATYVQELAHQDGLPVRTMAVSAIRDACGTVANLAGRVGAEQIILLRGDDGLKAQFLAYATPVFHPKAPLTWMVGHDRRAMQRAELLDTPVFSAIIVGNSPQDLHRTARVDPQASIVRPTEPTMLLARTGGLSIGEIQDRLR